MKYLLLLVALFACTTAPIAPPAVTVQPAPTTQCASGAWCYDSLVDAGLTPALLAATPGLFCPDYATVNHQKFWESFEKAVSYQESAWNTGSSFVEDFPISQSDPIDVVSIGLFQISISDGPNYPGTPCVGMTSATIVQPVTNVGCSMAIQNKLVAKGPFQAALGLYWSTIRDDKGVSALVKSYMPECFQ